MKKISATTLGCKVNQYDTQELLTKLALAGYEVTNFAGEAVDIHIVNTCCVTNTAAKKSRQAVQRAKKRSGMVVAVGCASQATPEKFEEIGADIVLGTSTRDKLLDHLGIANEDGEVEVNTGDKTRAFLKIQDGCDNLCTYCIIPHVRGLSRSYPLENVIAKAKHYAKIGHKEIVVAGICVATYGKDLLDCNLLTALNEICNIEGIERVRLSSVEPNVITKDFLDFVSSQPKLCDHFHLSLQSGNDEILAAMGRKYSTAQFADAVERLKKIMPHVSITTDVIAGFPKETNVQHQSTLDFISGLGLADMHVFPYSAKEGTVAAKMTGQLPASIKNTRAKELIELGKQQKNIHNLKFADYIMPVLVERRNTAGFFEGKTTNYLTVYFEAEDDLLGKIVDIRLGASFDGGFFGVLQ
ncbi:MAG: tRNA (N(6)-L-threonylcarbamoyladenosine(37)-C(2))-methylthiotransferase MtaB [Defluviitaleaceae bacterium]|nr:tRNA (N(6)-L-threonylcarbamoyladenosine(37)-C(2))-methylthiotransferase MtaB [Defluviitaleaceae bacterium]